MRATPLLFAAWLLGLGAGMGRDASAQDSPVTAAEAPMEDPVRVIVSVQDQKMAFVEHGSVTLFPISTSKFGLGDEFGSYKTPLGRFRVWQKMGENLPLGAVLKNRSPTGEVLAPNAPGRDPIVTRILWLEGLEASNSHSRERLIYIHGTPEETRLGEPVSWGCVRMRSLDVASIFTRCPVGSEVTIAKGPLGALLTERFGDSLECPSLPGYVSRVSVPISAQTVFLPPIKPGAPRTWYKLSLGTHCVPLEPQFSDLRYTAMLQLSRPLPRGARSVTLDSSMLARLSMP